MVQNLKTLNTRKPNCVKTDKCILLISYYYSNKLIKYVRD